jgi:hypothetical protein
MRGGLRTDTDCSGNGLGDKFAHRVGIQTPQPRLHSGLKAQRQPGADWARTQSTGIDTHLGEPNLTRIQHPVAARKGAKSLISYQELSIVTLRSAPQSRQGNR